MTFPGKTDGFILIFILVVLTAACSSVPTTSNPVQNTATIKATTTLPVVISPISPIESPEQVIPTPNPGTANVQGIITIKRVLKPLVGTALYLAPGVGKDRSEVPSGFAGKQVDTIQAFTDKQGGFLFENVPPGNYYIFIWAPLRWVLVTEQTEGENPSPYLLVVNSDARYNLGQLLVDWP